MIVRLLLLEAAAVILDSEDFIRRLHEGSIATLKLRDMRMVMMARQPRPIQRGPELSFHVGHS